jgi:methylmalonyl-CoA epimerase
VNPLKRIHHVGVAVPDLEAAAVQQETVFGMSRGLRRALPDRGVEVQFMHLPGCAIELLAPLGDESPVARFLARRGPGLHHLCYEVEDIHAAIAALVDRGVEMIDQAPRPGAEGKLVAFAQPRSTGGVLIELQQA